MGLLSILPANLITLETWLTRLFLFLALVTIGPWAVLLLYDLFLYVFRSITHEIPVVGGRARGRARPRAPSLTERPSGHRRKFSLHRRPARTTNDVDSDGADAPSRSAEEEKDNDTMSS
ncbi:hypothetical protein BDV96DRAFT_649682 [Lophiotrema nucula]|uniref:Uncharacterized protein n=1 Tax=Lophiotrema nucula TaxID=690887 RepID=A0A6A5YX27_9PLEO|nr:hypothetical protein BDV96DRAFT_649682 [Lophiotrema nucula]